MTNAFMNSKKYKLFVEACQASPIHVWVEKSNIKTDLITELKIEPKSEGFIEKFFDSLKKAKINLGQINSIYICKGPGSYIGSRTVATIFNIISYQENIPLFGFQHDQDPALSKPLKMIVPIYRKLN